MSTEVCRHLRHSLRDSSVGSRARCIEHGLWGELQADGTIHAQREPFRARGIGEVPGLEDVDTAGRRAR